MPTRWGSSGGEQYLPLNSIVAIIGRPNVGKSTLFNRIVGRRKAITLDESGVTRDRHYSEADWSGCEFLCVDTGGIPEQLKTGLSRKVKGQIDTAIQEATVILLVLDGQAGLLPQEKETYQLLRKTKKQVLVVINKVDQASHEDQLYDFYTLTDELYPVSAEHGYRISELLDAIIKKLPKGGDAGPEKQEIKVAIIGRPNVGKSSLLNHLMGEERVVVDDIPGTTRDVIDTVMQRSGKFYRVLDTAGIRRRGKRERVERFSIQASEDAIARSDVCLLLLDATEGIHKQDAHIAGYIRDAGKGVLILWNKWDLLQGREKDEALFAEAGKGALDFLAYAPQLFISAKTGEGCGRLWEAINQLHQECGVKLKTSRLNEAFENMLAHHNPPVYAGKPVKFFYITQVKQHPPTFLVFVNEPKGVHFSFERYLINGLRRIFKLGGAPIRINFRRKR